MIEDAGHRRSHILNEQILSAIRGRLHARGLDAYIAYTPSNVFYATGFQSYFLMQWWRMQGTVLAVIPADESAEVGMMVGDFEAKPARRVSGSDRTVIEPGIVLAIETTAYTTDAGAIMIEDLIHILPDGIERLHKLPHGLRVAP